MRNSIQRSTTSSSTAAARSRPLHTALATSSAKCRPYRLSRNAQTLRPTIPGRLPQAPTAKDRSAHPPPNAPSRIRAQENSSRTRLHLNLNLHACSFFFERR